MTSCVDEETERDKEGETGGEGGGGEGSWQVFKNTLYDTNYNIAQ